LEKEAFGAFYYANCCGHDYAKTDDWESFFGNIADRIIDDFNPARVLDVGCAWGYLVAALRDRGVEAYGIDVSEYAIKNVREDIKAFCSVCSITEPLPEELPQSYDLITCIEVFEHMHEEDGLRAMGNICNYSDKIIFSSSPDDITEQTHYNVQQLEYWSRQFAKNNFYRSLAYLPDYISPQAVFFQKQDLSAAQIVDLYERQIRIISLEGKKIAATAADTAAAVADLNRKLTISQDECAAIRLELSFTENKLNFYKNSIFWHMTKPIRILCDFFKSILGRE
jgi:SAM-dependent methyltransferase